MDKKFKMAASKSDLSEGGKSDEKYLPETVRLTVLAINKKLGRPVACRQVKGHGEWWITDPVLSFFQRGTNSGPMGYRAGYCILRDTVSFRICHSPASASMLRRNLTFETLIKVIKATAKFRQRHVMFRSSRIAWRKGLGKRGWLSHKTNSSKEFVDVLTAFDEEHDFVRDLFPKISNSRSTKKRAVVAGNDFALLLSTHACNQGNAEQLIGKSWPLFQCLYPVQPLEIRNASLARSLRSKRIERICEFEAIQIPRSVKLSIECGGNMQAAHIKPHQFGGSDRAENGIWLCERHHRLTEGKLVGNRSCGKLGVRFMND